MEITKDYLENLYYNENLGAVKISRILGCTKWKVYDYFKKFDIVTKKGKYPELCNKSWLETKYLDEKMSTGEIASLLDCNDTIVSHWMNKHGIKSRTLSEARQIKHWGNSGENNPMYGVRGSDHPGFKGGLTPVRQKLYASEEWKKIVSYIWKRDNASCRRCNKIKLSNTDKYDIHHIISFQEEMYRCDTKNLVLLCKKCHRWVHGKENVKDFLLGKEWYGKYGN